MATKNDKEDAMGAPGEFAAIFSVIRNHIYSRSGEASVDTSELITIIEQIEQEVKQGSSANLTKIERWLNFLAELSPDTFNVTSEALLSPGGKVAEGIRSVMQKIKEKRQQAKPSQRDVLEGKWTELRGRARERWDDLTDDEWDQISSRRDRWSDVLQEKYGYSETEARHEIDDFLENSNLPGDPTVDAPDPDDI